MTPDLTAVEHSLLENLDNPASDYWETAEARAGELLQAAKDGASIELANRAWFLHKVAETWGRFVRCFAQIRQGQFFEAWCDLERVEIALSWLKTNEFCESFRFPVSNLQTRVARWQSLYPYKVFFSPGILEKRKECSICHKTIDPWSDCQHEVGRVYGGHECYYIVTQAELIEVSLVLDPVQKYAVVRGTDQNGKLVDHHDYSLVRFVGERLTSPFDGWDVRWTEAYHPHEMFLDRTSEGGCPCGSGRTYLSCCESRPGIIRPHAHVSFEQPPRSSLPEAHFAGYAERNGPAVTKSRIRRKAVTNRQSR